MIIDIFKTSIYKTSIKNIDYIKYFDNFLQIKKKLNNGNTISNVGGFQTISFNDLDNNKIKEDIFIKPAYEYIKQFNKNYNIELLNFWVNSNNNNDYNLLHNHTGCNISGVYYVKAPENSGRIVFQNGDLTKMNSKNQNYFDDANFYSRYFIEVKQYDLLLFPSETFHYVEPNRSNEERISVAFNLILK
jgi:uncharacterized protein (TIGR02466 family)